MDTSFQLMVHGFSIAMQPTNLMFALAGCFIGTLIGVLPGIGPTAGVAILIPVTFNLEATPAVIMLAAIYYGAMYGGTITSVLMNVPGEASSAVTCLDGYQMAKQGRAGAALAIAAIGSFVGGNLATLGLALLALPLAAAALRFGPPETFSLMVLGLSLVSGLAGKSLVRSFLSVSIGLQLAMVGTDPGIGSPRFTFGYPEMEDGVKIVTVAMGLFGVGEILYNLEDPARQVFQTKIGSIMLTSRDLKDSIGPILRGSLIGFLFG